MSVLLDRLLEQLRIVSKIPEGGRICTSNLEPISVEDSTSYQCIKRYISGDSRQKGYVVLDNMVSAILDISNSMITSRFLNTSPDDVVSSYEKSEREKRIRQLESLCTNIDSSLKGLGNLHGTYQGDATISSKLEGLIKKLEDQATVIKEKLENVK